MAVTSGIRPGALKYQDKRSSARLSRGVCRGNSMSSSLLVLQAVVAFQAIQALALLLAVGYLSQRLRTEAVESRRRERAQMQDLAAELDQLRAIVRAARAESATYLEAVFSGVRGMARNLDAARDSVAQTLQELRRRPEPSPVAGPALDPPPDDSATVGGAPSREEMRPEVVRLPDLAGAGRNHRRQRAAVDHSR